MIIRRGGGANIDAGGAVLICETKAENSASISKSGKTVRLTPDKAFHGDDAGKANYIFPISKSDLGVWTLAVSKDEESNSKEVTLAAGDLLTEKLNISNGIILSPETGLDPNITLLRGTYNENDKTISFGATGVDTIPYGIGIKGFDPSDYTKLTIRFSDYTSYMTLSISVKKGNNIWGLENGTTTATSVVINRDADFVHDDGDGILTLAITNGRPTAVVTSIIFE
jgi:hypothetical protein